MFVRFNVLVCPHHYCVHSLKQGGSLSQPWTKPSVLVTQALVDGQQDTWVTWLIKPSTKQGFYLAISSHVLLTIFFWIASSENHETGAQLSAPVSISSILISPP